ncbi:MAG: DbpA RNA binding domain-containing protein, partial [Acidobacteria bacterium]|nr:DbpA RNA binding domain-containing protein [Acidobacteriota bacterium]
AVLAFQLQRERPLQPPPDKVRPPKLSAPPGERRPDRPGRPPAAGRDAPPMDRYRIQVGNKHGATARHIVGALANEAGLTGKSIGRVRLNEVDSTVELPANLPEDVLLRLRRVRVLKQALAIQLDTEGPLEPRPERPRGERHKTPRTFAKADGPPKARHKATKVAGEEKWWERKKSGGRTSVRSKTTGAKKHPTSD